MTITRRAAERGKARYSFLKKTTIWSVNVVDRFRTHRALHISWTTHVEPRIACGPGKSLPWGYYRR